MDAVRCAVKVQQAIPQYDGDTPPDRRIRFRIGINIGDVIPEGTNLHGDGVNIAARLEAACPVGGICVSRSVRDHVHGRLNLPFEPLGPLTLKNIAGSVEGSVLRLDKAGIHPARPRHLRPVLLSGLMVLLIWVTATGWLYQDHLRPYQPAQVNALNEVGLAHAPRLSLVVLPLKNLGGLDSDTVDGITEDLTTNIARIPGFLVIARNSAFTYKAKPIDIRRIGEELGVRYAVEGSARKNADAMRVAMQLVS